MATKSRPVRCHPRRVSPTGRDARFDDCLKAILRRSTAVAREVAPGELARDLGISPGGTTALVKDLASQDLVTYRPYKGVRLTESGRERALEILRRHRLLELFLVEILGMDWSEVHPEAEALEHVISERVVQRLDATLGHPQVDPHGDPIPPPNGELPSERRQSLLSCDQRRELTVSRIDDQSGEFLRLVDRMGLRPGSRVRVQKRNEVAGTVQIQVPALGEVNLGMRAASKILVA